MKRFRDYKTDDLIRIACSETDDDAERYDANWTLIGRFRKGVDIDALIRLMQSEKIRDRLTAAYILYELGDPIEQLRLPLTQFADDSLAYCRRMFVFYVIDSCFRDDAILIALAKCLMDFDLSVRAPVIRWAIWHSAERFEDFCQYVEQDIERNEFDYARWKGSYRKRAIRGLDLIHYMRKGENVDRILAEFPGEDSFVFHDLLFYWRSREDQVADEARHQKRP